MRKGSGSSRYKGRRYVPPSEQHAHRINENIHASSVRIVGDEDKQGIYNIETALSMAKAQGLDLVEVFGKGEVPVCKIIDYAKFIYDQKKKKKIAQSKSSKTVLKEVRFGPQTADHDYEFKKRQIISFLSQGNRVRAVVQFRGRMIHYKSHGEDLLKRLAQDLTEHGRLEQEIRMEGKKMFMLLVPAKTKKNSS